jgi:long-chain acyl-CoA synthetase
VPSLSLSHGVQWPDPRTFGSLLELHEVAARTHGDAEAVAMVGDDGLIREWSGREFLHRANLAAWRLRAMGLAAGDRLLTWAPSSPALAALFLGAIRAGVVLVPLDLRMTPEVVERIAARADAAWLVLGTGRDAPDPREVRLPAVQLRTLEALTDEPAGVDPGHDVPFPDDWEAELGSWSRPDRDSPFAIMYTSGTTGTPKGAILSHGNILGTLEAADLVIPRRAHRIVSVLPLSHLFGQVELFYALFAGAPILYVRSRMPRVIFQAIRDHRVTTMVVVPQVLDLFWDALLREVDRQGRRALFERLRRTARHLPYPARRLLFGTVHRELGGGLRLLISAAAYLPPALQIGWEDLGITVLQGYGATECGFATAQTIDRHPPGSVGRPVPPVQVRIDPADGEIQVAGPTVFGGYWREPEATAEVLRDGWYRTGDVGSWGPDGDLVLSGRIRNLIVLPNGFNVYPEDIENALRAAGIREAVAVETEPGRIEAVVLPPDVRGLRGTGEELDGSALAADGTRAMGNRTSDEADALRARIETAVRAANRTLDAQQRIAGWRLWPDADFPRTHTLKIRRDVVGAWVAVGSSKGELEAEEAAGSQAPGRRRGLLRTRR